MRLEGSGLSLLIEKDHSDVIEVNYKGGDFSYKGRDYEDIEMTWIDLSAYGSNLLSYFTQVKNLEEHLASVDPYILNEKELNSVSYILGRKYESCSFNELEIDEDDIPEYMGLGELSSLYIYIGVWLERLNTQYWLLTNLKHI